MNCKHVVIVLLVGLVSLTGCGRSTPTPSAQPTPSPAAATPTGEAEEDDLVTVAQTFVEALAARQFELAVARFDDTMRGLLPADKLEATWDSLILQVGGFIEQSTTRTETLEGYDIVYVLCQFESATLEAKVVFDQQARIAGLFFVPPGAAETYEPPDYADLDAIQEIPVTVGSGEWALPGTLTAPLGEGPYPAVVLVHGSGNHDRDESVGPNKPFRDLAWGLASQGVAVLRYEKRTEEHAAKIAQTLEELTVYQETIEDALLAVALLRQQELVHPERIFVLGHSLGGMLAPRIGQADPQIAGLIVMAGNTRPMEDLIQEQLGYVLSLDGTSEQEQQAIATMEAMIARVKDPALSPDTPVSDLPLGIPAGYWLDLRDYRPAEVAQGLALPMLILQGERDYQVTMADFAGWQTALAGRDDVTLKLYPTLNHLFMEGEGMATPAEYEKVGNVAKIVIDDIAVWVLAQ